MAVQRTGRRRILHTSKQIINAVRTEPESRREWLIEHFRNAASKHKRRLPVFKGKYRIQSTRLPGWDYSRGGKYYVTLVTRNRICYFGDVVDGKMILNEMGKIVHNYWLEIPECFPDTWLDEYIIMPNHLHGIIVMKRNESPEHGSNPARRDETRSRLYIPKTPENIPENHQKNEKMSAISPKPGSLSVIMGGLQSKCTKAFNKKRFTWHGWQSRPHDRIIRDERHLNNVRNYIRNNPNNWKGDEFYL